jgi:hypothetical protein
MAQSNLANSVTFTWNLSTGGLSASIANTNGTLNLSATDVTAPIYGTVDRIVFGKGGTGQKQSSFDNILVQTVPEPGAGLLLLGALPVLMFRRRRD